MEDWFAELMKDIKEVHKKKPRQKKIKEKKIESNYHKKILGILFEHTFKNFLKTKGLKEKKDFIQSGKHTTSYPDYYIPSSKTYIEVKFSNTGHPFYSKKQMAKMKELKAKGFDVKTIIFSAKVVDPLEHNDSMNLFVDELIKKKKEKEFK